MLLIALIVLGLVFSNCTDANEIVKKPYSVIVPDTVYLPYTEIVPGVIQYNYLVKSAAELTKALSVATRGEVIFVDNDAKIDMTGQRTLTLKGGVTLMSGRTKEINGGLIYTTDNGHESLIKISGDNAKIMGIRLLGPDTTNRDEQMKEMLANSRVSVSQGIYCSYKDLEVSNSELWGWSHAGMLLKSGATNAYIHHNYIHHNQRSGYGYGIYFSTNSNGKVMYNVFDWNRHSIAGNGSLSCGYEAGYNVVLANSNGHAFDMHGGSDRNDGTEIAGNTINIHDNIFFNKGNKAVGIRGIPTTALIITNNKFAHSNQNAAFKLYSPNRATVTSNTFRYNGTIGVSPKTSN